VSSAKVEEAEPLFRRVRDGLCDELDLADRLLAEQDRGTAAPIAEKSSIVPKKMIGEPVWVGQPEPGTSPPQSDCSA
jgi:hypothetical protein